MLKLKLQYFGHLMQRTDSLEKTLMLGEIEGKRRGQQRMRWLDGITNSMDIYVYVCQSHSVVSESLQPHELYSPWNSPGQNTGAANCSLLQGIFPTTGSSPGLPHCRRITSWAAFIKEWHNIFKVMKDSVQFSRSVIRTYNQKYSTQQGSHSDLTEKTL